jgi:branched-chain amino acid transport system permease protein
MTDAVSRLGRKNLVLERRQLARRDLVVPLAIFAALALAPLAAAWSGSTFWLVLAGRAMIFAIAAVSLDLILGYGALVSFGHAAFLGLGAYAVGILASHGITDAAIAFPVAIGISVLFAGLTGAVSLKTRGVHFIMITLAFGQMAFFTATSLSAYGGDDGLTIWSRSTLFGWDGFENDWIFYYLVLGCLVGAYALSAAIIRSRFGRVLRGCRESELRMQALGYDPYRFRLVAYCIAGAVAGLAGALLANQVEFVSPAYMTWQRSGELIFMVVLGGMASLTGPILGAGAFLLLEEFLSGITEHWKMIFGPILVLTVLFARGGIVALLGRTRHG